MNHIKQRNGNIFMKTVSKLLIFAFMFLYFHTPGIGEAKSINKKQTPMEPAVKIVSPEPGSEITIGDRAQIQVALRPGIKAALVQITCDGNVIGLPEKPPYTAQWDTSGLKEGAYEINAYVYLNPGKKLAAEPVTVNLKGGANTGPAMLREGMPVILATEEFMKSGETQTGSTVRCKVDKDVITADGRILIPEAGQCRPYSRIAR